MARGLKDFVPRRLSRRKSQEIRPETDDVESNVSHAAAEETFETPPSSSTGEMPLTPEPVPCLDGQSDLSENGKKELSDHLTDVKKSLNEIMSTPYKGAFEGLTCLLLQNDFHQVC
jgi:hypothetical protein